ncbi:hypothetical protein D3C83_176300 [compost metagenome]
MARKPITKPGTSDVDTAPMPPAPIARCERTCIHVSNGITPARKILRVSFVTVATVSTMLSS